MRHLSTALKVLGALASLCLLWWMYRRRDDHVGEMVCDMDEVDDDPGEDLDAD